MPPSYADDVLDVLESDSRPVLLAVLAGDTGGVWKADFLGTKQLEDVVHCWAEAHAPGEPLPDGLRVTAGPGGPDLPLCATLQALRKRLPIFESRYAINVCWPGGVPEASGGRFDGAWRLPKGRSAVIRGSRLRWSDGSSKKLHREGRTLSMYQAGATLTAMQKGETLKWSNGEIWHRERGSKNKGGFGVSASGRSREQMAAIRLTYAQGTVRRERPRERPRARSRSRVRSVNVN